MSCRAKVRTIYERARLVKKGPMVSAGCRAQLKSPPRRCDVRCVFLHLVIGFHVVVVLWLWVVSSVSTFYRKEWGTYARRMRGPWVYDTSVRAFARLTQIGRCVYSALVVCSEPISIIMSSSGFSDGAPVADKMDQCVALAEYGLNIPDLWHVVHPWYRCPVSLQP